MATNYDQYMAESGQQSLLDQQRKNGTYAAAASGWNPNNSGSSTPSTNTASTPDYNSILQAAIKAQQEANQPAIQSMQASIPTTQKLYEQQGQALQSQVQPLTDRYNALLNEVKGNQTQAVNQQTLTTGSEMGRRGIQMSSGLAQQNLNNAINPINQAYTSQYQTTGADMNTALAGLNAQIAQNPTQEAGALNQVQQAIGQLQAGGNSQAIQAALSQYQAQNQAALAQAQLAANESYRQDLLGIRQQNADTQQNNVLSEILKRGTTGTGTGTNGINFLGNAPSQITEKSGQASTPITNKQAAAFNASNYTTFKPM